MGRKSTVAVLDESIVEQVNKLVRAGTTIDEIVRVLHSLDADVSRSAVGRYVKSARESMEKYRQAQEVAKVWVEKLESEPQGDVARLLPEMLRTVAFQTLETLGKSEDSTSPQELMFLAKALKDLSGASKLNVDIEMKLREARAQAKAEAVREAADRAGDAARAMGQSEEQAQFWMRKVLGVQQ